MAAIGLLDPVLPSERFAKETAYPIRPGSESDSIVTASKRPHSGRTSAAASDAARVEAEAARARAEYRVHRKPTSNTWARLAQAHMTLGEVDGAVTAARAVLSLVSIREQGGEGEGTASDPTSLRIAAEILSARGEIKTAYEALLPFRKSAATALTFATAAHGLGRDGEALAALDGRDDPLVESFKGFLKLTLGSPREAMPHLRIALQQYPEDADAAMNLAVAMWEIGARNKALASALRATRTAPGRRDLSLGYLEMLLSGGQVEAARSEVKRLRASSVVADARFLVIQARLLLLERDQGKKALGVLGDALALAHSEGDASLEGEIAANRATLRYDMGRMSREEARDELAGLMQEFPGNDAVLINYCHVVTRRSEAPGLRAAFERLEGSMPVGRQAYLRHQLALLEGDVESSADTAMAWFESEKHNPAAASAAVLALGIGVQRWSEAERVARFAIETMPMTPSLANNVSYALAMCGHAAEAKSYLEPWLNESFILVATLGLACLANGEIPEGMRLYREAALRAERDDPDTYTLMATYQAMVVRQLGLDTKENTTMLSATSLAPLALPEDWEDRPEFLQLHGACERLGYPWPLTL